MLNTPFRFAAILSFAHIIVDLCILCKKLLPPRLHHRAADLPQTHLRNIAGGNAQGVDGAGRVKGVNALKILRQYIGNGRQGQASHQHIGNAALQRPPVCDLYIQRIQFLQHTAAATIQQIPQIVLHIIRHGVAAGGQYSIRQIVLFGQCAEGGLQRFDDLRFKGLVHRPDRQRTGKTGRMGIRHVEVELQTVLPVITKYGNALGPAIDPAAKLTIPALHLKDRRGVRALGVDQNLIIEGAFVIVAGRAEKARPAFVAAGNASHGLVVQFGDELKFGRHGNTSYLSGSARFFAASRSFFCCSFWAFSNGFRW